MKAKSSGLQTNSAQIIVEPCWYLGTTVVADNATDLILAVWDSKDLNVDADSMDIVVDYLQCTDENYNQCHIMRFPVWCPQGIYAKMDTASEGDYIVWYAL